MLINIRNLLDLAKRILTMLRSLLVRGDSTAAVDDERSRFVGHRAGTLRGRVHQEHSASLTADRPTSAGSPRPAALARAPHGLSHTRARAYAEAEVMATESGDLGRRLAELVETSRLAARNHRRRTVHVDHEPLVASFVLRGKNIAKTFIRIT